MRAGADELSVASVPCPTVPEVSMMSPVTTSFQGLFHATRVSARRDRPETGWSSGGRRRPAQGHRSLHPNVLHRGTLVLSCRTFACRLCTISRQHLSMLIYHIGLLSRRVSRSGGRVAGDPGRRACFAALSRAGRGRQNASGVRKPSMGFLTLAHRRGGPTQVQRARGSSTSPLDGARRCRRAL